MMGQEGCAGLRWVALVCFLVIYCKEITADDFTESGKRMGSCDQVCRYAGVQNGCQRSAKAHVLEEVVVVADKGANVGTWDWGTIHMVVSTFDAGAKFGLPACMAHSKGKRFGLKEKVPDEDYKDKASFVQKIKQNYQLLMADNMVYDLLDFFSQLNSKSNNTEALLNVAGILGAVNHELKSSLGMKEAYCVLPWEPPGKRTDPLIYLLMNCDVLLLSPDSYNPQLSKEDCVAQATIPIPKFLYGIERYIALHSHIFMKSRIVAGIPWHGYLYECQSVDDNDKCTVKAVTENGTANNNCFDKTNRHRLSLAQIYAESNLKSNSAKLDPMNQALFYTMPNNSQLWYENYTTLILKYQLVKDLQLRGLSIWYGDDMEYSLSVPKNQFAADSWNFLMHHVLHNKVFRPVHASHYYADTIAGVSVGCLLLGTALGVTFTCIAFRKCAVRRPNRPFKLDEEDDDFRDDEGL